MQTDKELQLRKQLIDYIVVNTPWHTQTELEQYSTTALTIFKAEIDAKLADKKKNDGQ